MQFAICIESVTRLTVARSRELEEKGIERHNFLFFLFRMLAYTQNLAVGDLLCEYTNSGANSSRASGEPTHIITTFRVSLYTRRSSKFILDSFLVLFFFYKSLCLLLNISSFFFSYQSFFWEESFLVLLCPQNATVIQLGNYYGSGGRGEWACLPIVQC